MGDKRLAILKTLLYSSLFQFPLTEEELFYYFNASRSISRESFRQALSQLVIRKEIVLQDGYYAILKQKEAIQERIKREKINSEKYELARRLALYLSFIPSILFIGISGSLAVKNATQDDDIDYFVITEKNTLYTTRFLALLLLEYVGRRRKRNATKARDKACLNFLISEEELRLPEEKQDLYTAREIAQLVPLVNREDTYQRFLQANSWRESFLPHSIQGKSGFIKKKRRKVSQLLTFLEPLTRSLQLSIMKPHQTVEEVTKTFLALHPDNVRNRILVQFAQKLLQYKKYYKRWF